MCVHCCEKTVDDKVYCLSCYATHSLVPLAGCDGSKAIAEMHQELREQFNFDHVDKLPFDEVEETYNNMEFARKYKRHEKNVPFPMYCSSKIDLSHQWSKIANVDLQYGAAFLSQQEMKSKHIPGILNLFGSLVTYEKMEQLGWLPKLCNTMPAMIVRFAANSHLGCGYRLLAHCARHTFDLKMPPIDKEMSKLIMHNGEIGIHLTSNVPH
jgi:hypothetical protein